MFQGAMVTARRRFARGRVVVVRMSAFDRGDWCVLAEATVTLLVVQAALRVIAFPRLVAWATRTRGAVPAWTNERVKQAAWLVTVGGRVTGARCLARSLALSRILARRGIATELRIGVQTLDGSLKAHAWVESQGRPLLDTVPPFAPFDRPLGEVVNV